MPVVNHAMMGETAPSGLARFVATPENRGALCVIEYGGNDCDLDWARVCDFPDEPILAKVTLEDFAAALRGFVTAARERGMEPLLVTPPPLHARRYFATVTRGLDADRVLSALGDVEHIYRWQERYTIAMRQIAAELGCRLLDVRDAFLAQRHTEALMSGDGIHPSDAGHRLIADTALEAIHKRCGELILD